MREHFARFLRAASDCWGEATIVKQHYSHFKPPDSFEDAENTAFEFLGNFYEQIKSVAAASVTFDACRNEAPGEDIIETIKTATLQKSLRLPSVMVDGTCHTTFHAAAKAYADAQVRRVCFFDPQESAHEWIQTWIGPANWASFAVDLAAEIESFAIEPLLGGLEAECKRTTEFRTQPDGLANKQFHHEGRSFRIKSPQQLALMEALWRAPGKTLDFDGINTAMLGPNYSEYSEANPRAVKNRAYELTKKMKAAGMPLKVSFDAESAWKFSLVDLRKS